VNFGPHAHLGAQEFFDLMRLWSWRFAWENPQIRNTGIDSQQGAAFGQ